MTGRKFALAAVCLVLLGLAAGLAWAQITTQEARTVALALRPYQVLSGQVASTNFEVVYVLDNESRRLAVLKYDWSSKQLLPIAGRNLPQDFQSDQSGGYSMVTTQLGDTSGLLYVTDYATHRAIVYQVDLGNNRVTPQQPVDLKKLFGD